MTAENFQRCLAVTLREEGGNDDDPHDHGGRTSRGIIQRVYDSWRASQGLPPQDVWKATDDEVRTIYHDQYWLPYCDVLPAGLDLSFFDFCVNAGRQQAVKCLQRALGIRADGMFGLATRDAINSTDDLGGLIHNYCDQRRAFYSALRQFPRYGRGWMARTDRVEHSALGMANASPQVAAVSPKADADDAGPMVSPEAGAATTTGTTVGYGVMDQIQSASSHLYQFQNTLSIVKYILLGIAIIGLGFTVYGIWKRRKVKQSI